MGSHYDELQMSCIMTADALAAYFDPNGEYYQNYRQRTSLREVLPMLPQMIHY